jgi:very-short-patch-repair endonuclease
MLKEHFRCVPAIIEFSNREFYENEIRPLRIPLASERLDPPLIDVYVKGGYKKGEANPPEAVAIVNEIQRIIENPSFIGRTIGVVTLRGIEQGKYISSLISQRIDQKEILSRKIDVGQPAYFQGSERDIMMVSLVLAPGDGGAPRRADMEQRFNVALSRARDRMYLFRSVLLADFNEDSLTAKVIRHFTNPFIQDAAQLKNLREFCESDFEKEVFDYLAAKNYRVTPQVKCGGYRIDMVVEGAQGRRLAIECDGDRFHGPGQWSNDMARQRVLERAGWAFWRCFASSFTLRRDEVLADLMATLEKMQIEPIGAATVDNSMWVSSIEVDPFEVESKDEETLL